MSCNYYFEKWKNTLKKLDEIVKLDTEYQETKAHDKKWCDAAHRLTGVLAEYLFIYNETADCCQHNLQVQKATYMIDIVNAVVARILELKEQLRKLVGTEYYFMAHGLIDHRLTTNDIVLSNALPQHDMDLQRRVLVLESIHRAEERKRKSLSILASTEITKLEERESQKVNWWENDNDSDDAKEVVHRGINVTAVYDLDKKNDDTVEMLEIRKMATLIQTHERSRVAIQYLTYQKQKRERWEKELKGTLHTPHRKEIRERGASMIQRTFRAYFEIKRKRFNECKRDEILSMRTCEKTYKKDEIYDTVELHKRYIDKFVEYKNQWNDSYNKLKQKYIDKHHDAIENDIREEIMYWFRKWFDEASFFFDIPKECDGGSILIVKEELPSPTEWLEKYKAYLEEKVANKNKTAYELKYEKLEAKKEKMMQKRAEHLKKKMEEKILNKMMKNPKFHPGYHYPISKKIQNLLQAAEHYKENWSSLDSQEEPGVKEKYILDIIIDNAYMDAKIEIRKTVDVAMRENLDILNNALMEDYKRNGETIPERIKESNKRRKKHRKHKVEICKDVADKLENLAYRGFIKQYPHVRMEDFIGDPNFAGDDLQCALQATEAFSGETKALWWERCRELSHGFHRTLLVGAKGSGKTTFIHILASMNDAVLYEIDPAWVPEELLSAVYLQELATSLADCARATQPSVIYVRHVHRLYYTKAPPGEDMENLNLIKRYLLRKLMRKIHKTDKIMIAASCIDPWLARSKQMLKQFPNVILMPNTNYSTVIILLNNWLLNNHVIPRDINLQSLAHVLQGYSLSHIKETLDKFLTADRVIRIAAHGLPLHDIYECFLEGEEQKIEYSKYLKWYTERTPWGKKGKKFLEDQKEFQLLLEKWQQKEKKKKKLKSTFSDISTNVDSKL